LADLWDSFQEIHDEDVKKLGKVLKRFPSLKQVTFNFEKSGINDEGISCLSRFFGRCKSLENLDINFKE